MPFKINAFYQWFVPRSHIASQWSTIIGVIVVLMTFHGDINWHLDRWFVTRLLLRLSKQQSDSTNSPSQDYTHQYDHTSLIYDTVIYYSYKQHMTDWINNLLRIDIFISCSLVSHIQVQCVLLFFQQESHELNLMIKNKKILTSSSTQAIAATFFSASFLEGPSP